MNQEVIHPNVAEDTKEQNPQESSMEREKQETSTENNQENRSSKNSENSNSSDGSVENKEKELTLEEKMQIEIQKLKEEVENLKDHWQRERAEFMNYRKRTAHELMNSRKEAVRSFIHELLHPLDNLDIVTNIKTDSQELKAFVDGVNMVKKDFLSIIDKEGIKRSEPMNQPFDPMTMEAISSEESEDYKEEIVIQVYQPGYFYQEGETIHPIRPARVKVGKPKQNTEQPSSEQN